MKAMILNSGQGKRLWPLTKNIPKALIKVGENSILGHQLDCLTKCGINKYVITTGPFEDMIKDYIRQSRYSELEITYVKNVKYRTTNYIYSMWLARDFVVDEDIIVLHGDLVFDVRLLEKMLSERKDNCVLVNKEIMAPEKDFKAHIENDRVTKIGVEFVGPNTFFLAPLYKFKKEAFNIWMQEIGNFIKRGQLTEYAETAFNATSDSIDLFPLYYTNEFCHEVDTKEDLERAISILKKW